MKKHNGDENGTEAVIEGFHAALESVEDAKANVLAQLEYLRVRQVELRNEARHNENRAADCHIRASKVSERLRKLGVREWDL